MNDLEACEANFIAPLAEIRAGIVECIAEFDEHVQRHEQAENILTVGVVNQGFYGDKRAACREAEGPEAVPEIDWKAYRGLGKFLRHSYHRVSDEIVWNRIKEDVPVLRDIVKKALRPPAQNRPADKLDLA